MSTHHYKALAIVSVALLPTLSFAAAPARSPAHACVAAFLSTLATADRPAPRLKAARFYGLDDLLGSSSEIDLTAVNPRTGLLVARASCELSPAGKVLSIRAVPL